MAIGRSKAKIQMVESEEVDDRLRQPEEYTKNGCKIPRGVILDGRPGTGKTVLAKAVAEEAGVPLISISGSEFVEMFVGVGTSRVRDIFSQAKINAPCIIVIDGIDAVGQQRRAGFAGSNDEREQTVNQILVEMDGFEGNPGIITFAATNRVDILDQTLLRPGRFDRKVTVDPDFKGRAYPCGAQLENLINEAAIAAARKGKNTIGWEQIDGAVDRIMVGLEKKGEAGTLSAYQNELVTYHEAGHAIVGSLILDYDQVQKITIISCSNGAGGLTFFAPQENRLEAGLYSHQYLVSQLAVTLGGRLAEEIIFGEDGVTTGANNDFEQVASIAKRMVKKWGINDEVGRVALTDQGSRGSFMGRMMGTPRIRWSKKILGMVMQRLKNL